MAKWLMYKVDGERSVLNMDRVLDVADDRTNGGLYIRFDKSSVTMVSNESFTFDEFILAARHIPEVYDVEHWRKVRDDGVPDWEGKEASKAKPN